MFQPWNIEFLKARISIKNKEKITLIYKNSLFFFHFIPSTKNIVAEIIVTIVSSQNDPSIGDPYNR